MITVTKPYFPPLDEYTTYLRGIWESGQLTNQGPLVLQLERELKTRTGANHFQFLTNGTLALQIALRALDVTREVITTPFSYVATTTAILWEHCKPVFADVDDRTFCIDPRKVEAAITPQTEAILATHVYGNPCDVHALKAIADEHGLKIIYDGAHAFDTFVGDKSLLTYGDVTALSFHATKLFHTVEGGGLVIADEQVAKKAALMRAFGHVGDEYYSIGTNAKASELHAAMGLCLLPRVKEIVARRAQISAWYASLLSAAPLTYPVRPAGFTYNYAYYPVLFSSEDRLLRARSAMTAAEIGTRRYFHPSLNRLPYVEPTACPVSEDVARRVLCLPLYHELRREDVERICELVVAHA